VCFSAFACFNISCLDKMLFDRNDYNHSIIFETFASCLVFRELKKNVLPYLFLILAQYLVELLHSAVEILLL